MYCSCYLPGVIGAVTRDDIKVSLTGCAVADTSIELGLEVVAVCAVFNASIAGKVEVVIKDEDSEVCDEVVTGINDEAVSGFCDVVITALCGEFATVLCGEVVTVLCGEFVTVLCGEFVTVLCDEVVTVL